MKHLTTLTIAALLGMVVLTGCNTVKGLGRDIEKGGEGLQRAAD